MKRNRHSNNGRNTIFGATFRLYGTINPAFSFMNLVCGWNFMYFSNIRNSIDGEVFNSISGLNCSICAFLPTWKTRKQSVHIVESDLVKLARGCCSKSLNWRCVFSIMNMFVEHVNFSHLLKTKCQAVLSLQFETTHDCAATRKNHRKSFRF